VEPLFLRRQPVPPIVSGELTKAVLIDTTTGVGHPVMYNPEELRLEQGNTFAEIGIPGLESPPVQYVRGRSRTLTMELFFDSYEDQRDVRTYTQPIVGLLARNPQTLAPPVLLFSLGGVQFRCVLVDAGQRFTMFLRDGTPVRCTMSVRLQEYVDVSIDIQHGLFVGSPTIAAGINAAASVVAAAATKVGVAVGVLPAGSTVHLTVAGETLAGLAASYLGNPGLWRNIAEANGIDDPLSLPAGTALVIPK
jgi:hypothetical protein